MLTLYTLFFLIPLVQTIYYSFTDYNGINPKLGWIGLGNYRTVFKDI